jgi:F5/8 type C domain
MASKIEFEARAKRQAVVAKVVWGLLLMTAGVLLTLENLGTIDLGGRRRLGHYAASNAVDGDPETRWSSAFADPQWITIDLGAKVDITRVRLNWETAYARRYSIEISDDGMTFQSVKSVSKGTEGVDDLDLVASGRYLRVLGSERATQYGYSLWEIEVDGPGGLLSLGKPTEASSNQEPEAWALFWPWAFYWPVLMFAAGLPPLLAPKNGSDQILGFGLSGLGAFFELQNLGVVRSTLAQTWPILLMGAGLLLVIQAVQRMTHRAGDDDHGTGSAL